MMAHTRTTGCCIVGGGPAGMMLGYLLARAGVHVTVLEKHRDFNRDFRGDTVHPSTLEIFSELGLLDDFLKLPHQRVTSGGVYFGDSFFPLVDLSHVPTSCKFIALMPQWDLLNFLAARARSLAHFTLDMESEATGLVFENGRVSGVEVETPSGNVVLRAALVAACDGRHSTIRKAARMDVIETGVPIDALWFRLSRKEGDPDELLGRINYGKVLILINRGDYFQVGMIIAKDSFPGIQAEGLERFQESITRIAPYLGDRVGELDSWDRIKLLTVQINHLARWRRPGLLFIGDAAHAMSPAGGVGINLAIQDAVAAARILSPVLLREGSEEGSGEPSMELAMRRVQRRREFPARVTQALQKKAHDGLSAIFTQTGPLQAPWQMRVATRLPGMQGFMGRLIGMGFRPEHVTMRRTHRPALAIALGAVVGGAAFAGVLIWRGSGCRQSSSR